MRVYIFLTHSMSGIGGGQRYVLAKSIWLMQHGWQVCICHVAAGAVLLNLDYPNMKLFDIPELRAHPRILGKSRAAKAMDGVLGQCTKAGEVYIESSAPYLGIWGEILAQATQGRHLCYILEEAPSPEDYIFLNFKRDRHELAFIHRTVASTALNCNPENAMDCVLSAYNPSPIEDIPFEGQIVLGDCTIGCISRLDKPAVMRMMDDLAEFCDSHADIIVALNLIGDSPYGHIKKQIRNYENGRNNLRVLILGYMTPIPKQLVESFDLCIGKAGAASRTSEIGIPTIRYTLDTDELVGFDRYDNSGNNSVLLPFFPAKETLSDLLDDAILHGGLERVRLSCGHRQQRPLNFSEHIDFVPPSNSKEYYDCWHAPVAWQRRLVSMWLKFFGNTKYEPALMKLRQLLEK